MQDSPSLGCTACIVCTPDSGCTSSGQVSVMPKTSRKLVLNGANVRSRPCLPDLSLCRLAFDAYRKRVRRLRIDSALRTISDSVRGNPFRTSFSDLGSFGTPGDVYRVPPVVGHHGHHADGSAIGNAGSCRASNCDRHAKNRRRRKRSSGRKHGRRKVANGMRQRHERSGGSRENRSRAREGRLRGEDS